MTEAEAHEFVARWKSFLIPIKNRTETEAIRVMDRYCRIIFIGTLFISAFIVFFPFGNFDMAHPFPILLYCCLMLIFGLANLLALWSHSRLKEVRRILGYSQIVNPK